MISTKRTAVVVLATLLMISAGCRATTSDSDAAPNRTEPTLAPVTNTASPRPGNPPLVLGDPSDDSQVVDACGENIGVDGDVWAGLDTAIVDTLSPPVLIVMARLTGSNPTTCRPVDIVDSGIEASSVGADWATTLTHSNPDTRTDIFVFGSATAGDDELDAAVNAVTSTLPDDVQIFNAQIFDGSFVIIHSWSNPDGLDAQPTDVRRIRDYYSVVLFE